VYGGVIGSLYNGLVSGGQEMPDAVGSCCRWNVMWHRRGGSLTAV